MTQRNETTTHGVDGWCATHLDNHSGVHVYFPLFLKVKISHSKSLWDHVIITTMLNSIVLIL